MNLDARREGFTLAPGPTLPVPRIRADALRSDPDVFYPVLDGRPAVVTDALPDDPLVRDLTVDGLATLLRDGAVESYVRATGAREAVPAAVFFAALRDGSRAYNVLDHPLEGTALAGRVRTPDFLGANWLPADRGDLGISPLSLTISPAGNLSPFHADAYGMQGWMLLLRGRKRWTFFSARDSLTRLEPETAGVRTDPAAWAGLTRHVTVAGRGDLVFIPPGWAHLVQTLDESLGVGGSVLNEHAILGGMTAWLAERSLGVSEEFDLAALVSAHAPTVVSASGRVAVREALDLYAAWASRGSRLYAEG